MRKILSDYDGIWIDTEIAKAARWYFAAMYVRGDDPEINKELIQGISCRKNEARHKVQELVRERKQDIERTKKHAGGTRLDFAMRVWDEFLQETKREANEERVREELFPPAEMIREVLIDWLSKPIIENLRFFQKLRDEMSAVYWDDHPFGLVTQTESEALFKQFHLRREDGSSLWGEFVGLLSALGPYVQGRGFLFAECAGDHPKKSLYPPKGGEKVLAYRILCARLGVRPEETLTFEDTRDGVQAAIEAGIVCIGVKASGSTQDPTFRTLQLSK